MKWVRGGRVVVWLALSVAAAPQQSDSSVDPQRFDAALEHYRRGRHDAALFGFDELLRELGPAAPPPLRLDAALCELRLLRSRDAEQRVAMLVDDERWAADATFVLALASCQHAERAVVAARLPDAEPMAWAMATRAIERAEFLFAEVVATRPEWREAVRNLERTQRRRAEIEVASAAAVPPEARQEDAPESPPEPPAADPEQPPEVVVPEVAAAELTAQELAQLQRRVQERQQRKLRGRQLQRRETAGRGGKDW